MARSTVAILKTSPATVPGDYHASMTLAVFLAVLAQERDTVPATAPVRGSSLPRGIYGNVPKSAISGPALAKSDIAVSRLFGIPGRSGMRLQFRGELFNAFNQVNFALPVTNASATNFGQITATRDGDPGRIGQIAIKLLW